MNIVLFSGTTEGRRLSLALAGLALPLGWYFSGRWKRHGSLADEGGEGL